MPTSPKATRRPGGAPLKKSSSGQRPCKYGPRDEEGYCPKAPKKTSTRRKSAAKKPPCKYGPRGSDGYCPKKPKSAKPASNASAAKKVEYAVRVQRDPKATASQKSEALKAAGTAVAVDAAKSAARDAKRAFQKSSTRKQAVALAKKAAPVALAVAKRAAVPIIVGGAILKAGGAALTANRNAEARKFADREITRVKKTVKLTPQAEKQLRSQLEAHARKQAPTNSFRGK